MLNSLGVLFLLGNFNEYIATGAPEEGLKRLEFPPGYPPVTGSRYEPSTAIQQYSTGRSHLLGLSDDGKIWFWSQKLGVQIDFTFFTLTGKRVRKVVAGWDRSSAYVEGEGIVYWVPKPYGLREEAVDVLLTESNTIPNTDYVRKPGGSGSIIGEVICHVVLEGYLVFATDENRLFAHFTASSTAGEYQTPPIELTTFYPLDASTPFEIRDLQGSFRSFAIFTASGEVLIGSRSLLDTFFAPTSSSDPLAMLPGPTRIASLQKQSIISLAFGDYHVHALHANGTISSFGSDPGTVGAFGLGVSPLCFLRGATIPETSRDATLDGSECRTIWFEPLMEKWLQDSNLQIINKLGDADSLRTRRNPTHTSIFGNYFEDQGSRWDKSDDGEEDNVPAYHALKVSAAGWHSAALVLVDEERAERARRKHILPECSSIDRVNKDLNETEELFAIGFTRAYSFLYCLLLWFLGLTARDASEAPRQELESSNEGQSDRVRYDWEGQTLPDLPSRDETGSVGL